MYEPTRVQSVTKWLIWDSNPGLSPLQIPVHNHCNSASANIFIKNKNFLPAWSYSQCNAFLNIWIGTHIFINLQTALTLGRLGSKTWKSPKKLLYVQAWVWLSSGLSLYVHRIYCLLEIPYYYHCIVPQSTCKKELLFVVLKIIENEPGKCLRNWVGVGTRGWTMEYFGKQC